jgi:hypothetical protein
MRAVDPGVKTTRRAGSRPAWIAILLTMLLCAACALTLSVAVATHAWPRYAGPLALAAFALSGFAWLARGATFICGPGLQPKAAAHAARWMFLILFFPLPGWLLGWGGGSHASFWAAFAVQLAGLAAERWSAIAESRLAKNQARQAEA